MGYVRNSLICQGLEDEFGLLSIVDLVQGDDAGLQTHFVLVGVLPDVARQE